METVTYDPRRLSGVTVREPVEREFSSGVRIQFTCFVLLRIPLRIIAFLLTNDSIALYLPSPNRHWARHRVRRQEEWVTMHWVAGVLVSALFLAIFDRQQYEP
jgi:hypothetical protein